jgi:hypothetical protein
MATTVQGISTHADGGLNYIHLRLLAGAADTTVTYTLTGTPRIKMMGLPFKTTGTQGGVGAAYNEGTGVLTVGPLANNDAVSITVVI